MGDATGRQKNRPGEFELIRRYLAPLATHPGSFALEDDVCTLNAPDDMQLVMSKDMLVAGVHFFPDDPADLIARKALRVNLSDLAAKGVEPVGYMLGLGLPKDWSEDWLACFADGLGVDQSMFGLSLLGGDTVSTGAGPLTLSVTIIGNQPKGRHLVRGGAHAGDHLYVTGTIGDSALGMRLRRGDDLDWKVYLSDSKQNFLQQRYLLPQPRVGISDLLLSHASASMDISDGLIGDLTHLCKASGVDARVNIDVVPYSDAAKSAIAKDIDCERMALTGGDDYEILLAVPVARHSAFLEAITGYELPFSRIGYLEEGEGNVTLTRTDGTDFRIDGASFVHF